MKKKERIAIASETLDILKKGGYKVNGITIHLNKANYHAEQICLYDDMITEKMLKKFNDDNPRDFLPSPIIQVTTESALQAAKRLTLLKSLKHSSMLPPSRVGSKYTHDGGNDPSHVCVLNFASAKHPCGGFLNGSSTQEESIAYRSNLYLALSQPHTEAALFYERGRNCGTPIYTDLALYSGCITVFRNDDYSLSDSPYGISVITCAAPNRKASHDFDEEEIYESMTIRIERILDVAMLNKRRDLVLGAFGCGAFGNDPIMVATIFNDVIHGNTNYINAFDRIVFAINDDGPNFEAFYHIFKK